MAELNYREIKTKRPWAEITPHGHNMGRMYSGGVSMPPVEEHPMFKVRTQADFLREYYPSGHRINDPAYYPNIFREEEVEVLDDNGNPTGRMKKNRYMELVPRYAFSFQQVITAKQMVHLCGNDMQFDFNVEKPTAAQKKSMTEFREGWLEKDMEVAFFKLMRSAKITGDGAIAFYISEGKMGWKFMSYLSGDTLYPHYDSMTGKMTLFARSYQSMDDNGAAVTDYLEVWDEKYYYRYKRDSVKDDDGMIAKIKNFFKASGYSLVTKVPHGYSEIPVAYWRDDDGPCWTAGQDSIEGYELSFSQMAQNNHAFGEPILYLQGENVEATHDMSGTIKVLSMGKDDKAGYLQSQSASESYEKQLNFTYKMIYEQTFTVTPPELKSGDLPAAALKILYSPAVELAINTAHQVQPAINDVVRLFAYGFGVEKEKSIEYVNLPMKAWIEPYVHINNSSVVADLAASVQNGFLSKQTACEKIPFYAQTDEWSRIMQEQKESQEADLLLQIRQQKQAAEISENEETEE